MLRGQSHSATGDAAIIDALLYAVRDGIRAASMNYDQATCDITDDGRPPPRAGNQFAAIHKGNLRPGPANLRNLDGLYDFAMTLTMRVTIAMDRIGDQLIARDIALVPLGQRQGFNAKAEQLVAFLHMNWRISVLQGQTPNSANDNLIEWGSGSGVYGFATPPAFLGSEVPMLVGPDWLGADPEAEEFAIKAEYRFGGARRFQPQTAAVGAFL